MGARKESLKIEKHVDRLGTLALALCLGGAVLTQGCAVFHHYGPEKGQVVEKGTGKPVEGAAVVRVFVRQDGLLDSRTTSVSAQETVTDANGVYELSGKTVWALPLPWPTWFEEETWIWVYKPGYGSFGKADPTVTELPDGSKRFEIVRLVTLEERRSQGGVFPLDDRRLPRHTYRHFLELYNQEAQALGLRPILEEKP